MGQPLQTRWRRFLSFTWFLLFVSVPGFAQEPPVEYRLKAEMLERFTQFIEWPESSFPADSSFLISVIGKNPFGSYLDRFQGKTIQGRTVVVREFDSAPAAGAALTQSHVLFVAASEERHLTAILSATVGKPVLTVADTEGFARKGVLINFYRSRDYVRFEVNQNAIERSGLKVSSRLLKLARLVE